MESTVEETIISVLNQNYKDYEIICVNDGSNDNTESVIKRIIEKNNQTDIKYYFQKNAGKLEALNLGISKAEGKYITILDADDNLTQNSLELRFKTLENHPSAAGVYGDAEYMDESGKVYRTRKSRQIKSIEDIVCSPLSPIVSCTLMYRGSVLREIFPFTEYFSRANDIYIEMEAGLKGQLLYLPEILLQYRTYRRKNSLEIRKETLINMLRIIRKHYSGFKRVRFSSKQIFFQSLKFFYEIFSIKK